MTLAEIEAKESKQNEAFKEWISDMSQFFNIPFTQRIMLCDYVESLNREIADLESEKFRNKWK